MPKIPNTLKRLVDEYVFIGPKPGTKRRLTVKEQEELERKNYRKKEKEDRKMIERILTLGKEEDNFDKVIKNVTELFFSYTLSEENLIYLLKQLKQGKIYNLLKYIEKTMGIEKKREFEEVIRIVFPKYYYKDIPLTPSEYEQFSHPYKYVNGIKEDEDPHETYTSADDDGEYYTEKESTSIPKRYIQDFINADAFEDNINSDFRTMDNKFDIDEGKFKPLYYDEEPLTVENVFKHKTSRNRYKHPFFEKGGKHHKYNKRRTRRKNKN